MLSACVTNASAKNIDECPHKFIIIPIKKNILRVISDILLQEYVVF